MLKAENIRSAHCSPVLSKLLAARKANFLSLLVLAKKIAVLARSRMLAKTIRHPYVRTVEVHLDSVADTKLLGIKIDNCF